MQPCSPWLTFHLFPRLPLPALALPPRRQTAWGLAGPLHFLSRCDVCCCALWEVVVASFQGRTLPSHPDSETGHAVPCLLQALQPRHHSLTVPWPSVYGSLCELWTFLTSVLYMCSLFLRHPLPSQLADSFVLWFVLTEAFAVLPNLECGSVALPDVSLGGIHEKQEATVLASHTLPNSLVYGADWSWLLFHSLQLAPSRPCPSNLGIKTADLKGASKLPGPPRECMEDNDGEGYGVKPLTEDMRENGTWFQATAAATRDCGLSPEEANSAFSLLATCSFYDHALHLWEWEGN
ncbi:hypothetical protein P7K49_002245 [Saguinus oedipus]|uniref:Uncharacterized protein n=1 Tax=Saguinus oedipus TaxID=9490 RepID=A0ABQ9WGV7_SAGOE|nr:hypothetical protein P7K49_002245 [Saguinus oedipus]